MVVMLASSCNQEPDTCLTTLCENGGTCNNGQCQCPPGYSGEQCEIGKILRTEFGSISTLQVVTRDIFAIWWDPKFDHSKDAENLLNWLIEIREDCVNNLDMMDPPNPAAGYYYNVYIHHGKDDLLPEWWGNGQGTDKYGMPYLGLPYGAHKDYGNVLHEGFHIFQYSANSPGFSYSGDSQWYVESTAQWYSAAHEPDDIHTFVEAGAIAANPQLALWHSFTNEAPGDPKDWMFQVRQYGMHTYLYFLTEEKHVDPAIITGGFYVKTDLSPQEYLYVNTGGEALRNHFADWAAHNTAGFDYLRKDQVERAWLELELAGDLNNAHHYVLELSDNEANGNFEPPVTLRPRGWSYNVIKINNSEAATYQLAISGNELGSEGASSHFEARVVVSRPAGMEFITMDLDDGLNGSTEVSLTANDPELFIVIAAVPENFGGNQTYNYTVNLSRN